MAVILGNKYQSKNRDNFRKITGLSEANEKIKPENMPRIYGGIGEVYFNGQSAAGSSTGNGGGSTGTTDPNGGGGSGGSGSGGGSGGSGGSSECQCETLTDALIVNGIPCCVNGVDCEDGKPIQIQLDPNGGVPILPCDDPMPKPTPEDPVFKLAVANCQNEDPAPIFTQESGAASAASALSAAYLEKYIQENCPNAPNDTKYTRQSKIGFTDIKYTESCIYWSIHCSGCVYIVVCAVIENDNQITDEMREFYSKNKKKQYFVKDGKFYDACDPYGTPPSDDPIIMCDENGNQYSVSPDGNIKSL